jgi:hypothetical protein
MLYRGAIAAGLSRRTATTVTGVAAAGLGGWLVANGLLARAGIYHQASGQATPWFGVVAASTLLVLLAATRIPVVARILAAPGTPARLALPHMLRVVGVTFLLVMAQGHLPASFALPAGLGDIAAGLAAPFVARRLAHGGRIRAVWFNLFGILDLVVALGIGFLAGLGPWRPLEVTPSTEPPYLCGDPPVNGGSVDWWLPPFPRGGVAAPHRSRGQGGAPAATRGRTTLAPATGGACLAAREGARRSAQALTSSPWW